MNYPSLKERLEFWKFWRAVNCFTNAKSQLSYIIKNKNSIPKELYPSALTSFFILYANPFKKSNGVEQFPVSLIPATMISLHDEIITYRDKTFAHGDLKGKIEEFDDYLDFAVLCVKNGKAIWQSDWNFPSELRFKEYLPLCKHLLNKASYHAEKIMKRWHTKKLYPSKDGRYQLNIRDKEEIFFYEIIN